jgi:predicted transcriptional regulator
MRRKLPMGALEEAVMDVLWTDGGWLAPSEVNARLESERDLAYTTVVTVMTRLFEKGRLERKKDGRAFTYHPTSTRTEWAAAQMDQVLDSGVDRTSTLTHFLERLSDSDRTQLRRMLLARKQS